MSRLPAGWMPDVARRQSGLFTARQALEAGATVAQVRRRRETGVWSAVAGDALCVAGTRIDPWHLVQAVGLTWPDAVVALGTAARFHRLPVPDDGSVHIVVPARRRSRGNLVTHRMEIGSNQVLRAGLGLVTDRERTLTDCIGRLPGDAGERLVAWAATRELVSASILEESVRARPRTWGTTARRRAAADVGSGTLSAAERRLHRLIRRAGLRGWSFDQPVRDERGLIGRVDAMCRAARVVVEVDGYAYHARDEFQRDRTKQNRLVAAGWIVLRFTWADLTDRPGEVLAQLIALTASTSGTDPLV